MLKTVEVDIAKDVIIQCPKVEFKQCRAAKHCPDCEYFDGVAVMCPKMDLHWSKRYVIRCKHPIERRVQIMIKEDL